jgi:hypothetical protein
MCMYFFSINGSTPSMCMSFFKYQWRKRKSVRLKFASPKLEMTDWRGCMEVSHPFYIQTRSKSQYCDREPTTTMLLNITTCILHTILHAFLHTLLHIFISIQLVSFNTNFLQRQCCSMQLQRF